MRHELSLGELKVGSCLPFCYCSVVTGFCDRTFDGYWDLIEAYCILEWALYAEKMPLMIGQLNYIRYEMFFEIKGL